MPRYETNADFQRDYYKRRKLAGRSPGNDDSQYNLFTFVRSENVARIL